MDRWGWEQLDPWLAIRRELPIGALLCVIHGPTAGRRWEVSAARKQLHHAAAGRRETALRATPTTARSRGRDGARGRPAGRDPAATRTRAPRHHEHLPEGIDSSEIISTVHGRPSPTISASAGLQMRQ
jgi:hypothetical protein